AGRPHRAVRRAVPRSAAHQRHRRTALTRCAEPDAGRAPRRDWRAAARPGKLRPPMTHQPPQPEPTVLVDPATGRPVLLAPGRRLRPMQTADDDAGGPCPFCPGNEAMTPPEVDAERVGGPGTPWIARAFHNLYPA